MLSRYHGRLKCFRSLQKFLTELFKKVQHNMQLIIETGDWGNIQPYFSALNENSKHICDASETFS